MGVHNKTILVRPFLSISENIIERKSIMRFLGVKLDKNLSRRAHINTIAPKISEKTGLLYKSRQDLDNEYLK